MARIRDSLPMSEYLSDPGIGSSLLKNILSSPADFKAAMDAPSDDTKSTILGEAIHTAILEPHKFDGIYELQPEDWGPKNKGEGYKKWKEFKQKASDDGKIPIALEDAQLIYRVKHTALEHKPFQNVLKKAKVELTATATINEIHCKARADILTDDGWFWDLKTTSKPMDDESLSRTVFNWGYHFQAAHHSAVFQACGREFNGWGWVFVSTGTPAIHIVMRKASKELLNAGFTDWEYAMDLLNKCHKNNEWPGFSTEVREIGLPAWAEKEYE